MQVIENDLWLKEVESLKSSIQVARSTFLDCLEMSRRKYLTLQLSLRTRNISYARLLKHLLYWVAY